MSNVLTVGRVVASYRSPQTLQGISSFPCSSPFLCKTYELRVIYVWIIATINVRYLSHAFVEFDIAPLIVTNAVIEVVQITSDEA